MLFWLNAATMLLRNTKVRLSHYDSFTGNLIEQACGRSVAYEFDS